MGRDIDILYHSDSFAYSKRTQGFIPKTIFIKEPTAAVDLKAETVFFQDFGVPNPSELFFSIDESSPLLEITTADVYDVVNRVGRWEYLRWVPYEEQPKKKDVIAFLIDNGYSTMKEHVKKAEDFWVPTWPAMLSLVEDEPEWRSVDSDEARIKREERKRREDFDRAIAEKCGLCKSVKDLAKREGWFVHGKQYFEAVPCLADPEHQKRRTMAPWLQNPEEKVKNA